MPAGRFLVAATRVVLNEGSNKTTRNGIASQIICCVTQPQMFIYFHMRNINTNIHSREGQQQQQPGEKVLFTLYDAAYYSQPLVATCASFYFYFLRIKE